MDTQETRIYAAILIICVTVGTILCYFFISVIRQQRHNLQLHKKMVLAELDAIERERARTAHDLHDSVHPLLSTVKFHIDATESVSPQEKEQLRQASLFVDEIIRTLREISNDLMPTSLLKKGLVMAVEEYARTVERVSGLTIEVRCMEGCHVPLPLQAHIYRILQELIQNCRKHAGASRLTIKMENKKRLFQITVCDNGSGFDYEKALRQGRGIGLKSVRNRAAIMGGKMVVDSQPLKGTRFVFTIPLT